MKTLKIKDLIEIDTREDKTVFVTNDADFKGFKQIDSNKRNNLERAVIDGMLTVERWNKMEDKYERD